MLRLHIEPQLPEPSLVEMLRGIQSVFIPSKHSPFFPGIPEFTHTHILVKRIYCNQGGPSNWLDRSFDPCCPALSLGGANTHRCQWEQRPTLSLS